MNNTSFIKTLMISLCILLNMTLRAQQNKYEYRDEESHVITETVFKEKLEKEKGFIDIRVVNGITIFQLKRAVEKPLTPDQRKQFERNADQYRKHMYLRSTDRRVLIA